MPQPPLKQTRRRVFTYGHRLARTLAGNTLQENVFFLHMPKCGGTSVSAGLFGTVALSERIGVIDAVSTRLAAAELAFGRQDPLLCHEDLAEARHTFALREAMALTHVFWNTRLIYGHVLLPKAHRAPLTARYRLVSMFRDPRERALSNFRMAARAGVIANDLDAWLESPVARSMCQAFLRYLCGETCPAPQTIDRSVDTAIAALGDFAVIGFLDDLAGFQAAFQQRFGVQPQIPRYNVAPDPAPALSASQEAKLDRLLEPDRTIYAAAEARFRRALPRKRARAEGSYPVLVQQNQV